jgi:3-phosphoshikimate 1-carboxyvinyltransferase
MLEALSQMGVEYKIEENCLIIQGKGLAGLLPPIEAINCGNSATTLRLLSGLLCGLGHEAILTGSEGLQKRPMARIIEPLTQMGAGLTSAEENTAPLKIKKAEKKLSPIHYTLPVASAQVKTCLLLAALYADGESILTEHEPTRDHTEKLLAHMGVNLQIEEGAPGRSIKLNPPTAPLQPLNITIPGDISAAAFLIVGALITPRSEVLIKNVGLNPTRTGLLEALKQMGAFLEVEVTHTEANEPVGNIYVKSSNLHGIQISGELVTRMIDEFPAFAVAALYADGETKVQDARELRYKETDRISGLIGELQKLGVETQELEDGFILQGGKPLKCAVVKSNGDHRLAMALTLAGLNACSPLVVKDAEIISESFPAFIPVLKKLGANLNEVE